MTSGLDGTHTRSDVAGDPAPMPHATAEQVEAARHDSKLAQVLYHDWEAETYDDKWSISYDKRCVDYARDRFDATVPDDNELALRRALELGCGSGFFLLNLIQAGVVRRGSVTDISPGMVSVAIRNGETWASTSKAGLPTRSPSRTGTTASTWSSAMPCSTTFPTSSWRCVRCFGCSRPAGGSSSPASRPAGDVYARRLSRLTWRETSTRLPDLAWRRPEAELAESSRAAALEAIVDLHTFDPGDLEAMACRAGAVDVSSVTTEFTAAMLGWPLRTIEAAVPPDRLGGNWAKFAFTSWITLSWIDENLWRRVVPKDWYYNVMLTGVKPCHPSRASLDPRG